MFIGLGVLWYGVTRSAPLLRSAPVRPCIPCRVHRPNPPLHPVRDANRYSEWYGAKYGKRKKAKKGSS